MERLQIFSVAKEGLSPEFVPSAKSFSSQFPKNEVKKIIVVANCVVPSKEIATGPAPNREKLKTAPADIRTAVAAAALQEPQLSAESTELVQTIVDKHTSLTLTPKHTDFKTKQVPCSTTETSHSASAPGSHKDEWAPWKCWNPAGTIS